MVAELQFDRLERLHAGHANQKVHGHGGRTTGDIKTPSQGNGDLVVGVRKVVPGHPTDKYESFDYLEPNGAIQQVRETFGGWQSDVTLKDGGKLQYGRLKGSSRGSFNGYQLTHPDGKESRWSLGDEAPELKMGKMLKTRYDISLQQPQRKS